MTSITASTAKVLIGHPTFNRSIESHGSAHSADTNYNGWRGEGTNGNEDIGTQTDYNASSGAVGGVSGSITSGGRILFNESRRRKEDAIVDISLESMKYNGGRYFLRGHCVFCFHLGILIEEETYQLQMLIFSFEKKKIDVHSREKKKNQVRLLI